MTTRDRDPHTVAKLYEDCRERAPIPIDRLRTAVGIAHPEFSEFAKRCTVVNQFLCSNPSFEMMMLKPIWVRRPEPRGSSPLEQLRARTSFFHPKGELTGGNYGARF